MFGSSVSIHTASIGESWMQAVSAIADRCMNIRRQHIVVLILDSPLVNLYTTAHIMGGRTAGIYSFMMSLPIIQAFMIYVADDIQTNVVQITLWLFIGSSGCHDVTRTTTDVFIFSPPNSSPVGSRNTSVSAHSFGDKKKRDESLPDETIAVGWNCLKLLIMYGTFGTIYHRYAIASSDDGVLRGGLMTAPQPPCVHIKVALLVVSFYCVSVKDVSAKETPMSGYRVTPHQDDAGW